MKKPFSARVAAFSGVTRRGPRSFTINTRVTDGPDEHMDRPILVHLTSTLRARQLAESLLAWADTIDKEAGS